MTQFAGHPAGAADHLAVDDHPAAQPRADDGSDGRVPGRGVAELLLVGVQRGGVSVVEVGDRQAQRTLHRGPEVEPPPLRLGEVGGTPAGDHTGGAGRARRVQPDRRHAAAGDPGLGERGGKHLPDGLDRGCRTLGDPAGHLQHPADEEHPALHQDGGVGLRAADVEPDDGIRCMVRHRPQRTRPTRTRYGTRTGRGTRWHPAPRISRSRRPGGDHSPPGFNVTSMGVKPSPVTSMPMSASMARASETMSLV